MSTQVGQGVLDAIGNTPLVELRRVVPPGSARVVAKLESANPTGSMKDRMARALVERAAADGRLPPGGTVVEYTAGTTGVSLAFVCAALGYQAHFVYSDAFTDEKRHTMRAYGAEVTDVRSEDKRIDERLVRTMIATAGEISRRPGHWWCDQLSNHDGEAGYVPLGEELWRQADGRIDAFVHSVGTAHSIHGTARALRQPGRRVLVAAVEPAESAVLSGKPSGSHNIEGIGVGFVPPSGSLRRSTRSRRSRPRRPRGWRGGWPGKKASSRGRPPAPTWWPPCGWRSDSGPERPWPRSSSTRASDT
jgi:cysteine synthase A